MHIIADKQLQERNEKIRKMMEENVYQFFTNAEFKKLLDPDDPNNVVEDLTFQIINYAIEQARQDPSEIEAICRPKLGYNLKNCKSLQDCKQGKVIFDTIFRMLSKCDRDQFMKFRDGEISLSQFVRGIEERRTGRTYKVLDDIKDGFPESM